MDAIERIRIYWWGDVPVVSVFLRSAEELERARASADWTEALRSRLLDLGVATVPGTSQVVAIDGSGEGPVGDIADRMAIVRVDWEPQQRVPFVWPPWTPDELRSAFLPLQLDAAAWNTSAPARLLCDRDERKRRRNEALQDPEYRANLLSSALGVALVVLGLALALRSLLLAS